MKSETHKIIPFVSNNKYVKIPREQMIQSVIDNVSSRLLNDEQESYTTLLSLFRLLEPTTWSTAIICHWQDGEEKLKELCKLLKYTIPVNDFRDLLDERYLSKDEIPQSIKEARKFMKVVAVISAETERAFSLMNNIATDKINYLLVENISHIMTVKLIGKPWTRYWFASYCVFRTIKGQHFRLTQHKLINYHI
jgi:hypothetical protein